MITILPINFDIKRLQQTKLIHNNILTQCISIGMKNYTKNKLKTYLFSDKWVSILKCLVES